MMILRRRPSTYDRPSTYHRPSTQHRATATFGVPVALTMLLRRFAALVAPLVLVQAFAYDAYGVPTLSEDGPAVTTHAAVKVAETDGHETSEAGQTETGADDSTDGIKAAILPLHGEITDIMFESLKRRIDHATQDGATLIIFDMDTPGGLVTSSIAIADLIKNLEGVKTVAWVNPNAHSGGSIVAVACDEIVMAKSSRIGDSQVIMGGPGGAMAVPEDLHAKAFTPVLAEFRASARLRGYDQKLCEAFVLPQREVWWLENIATGEREFVFRAEKLKRMGEQPDAAKSTKKETKDDKGGTADSGNEPPPATPSSSVAAKGSASVGDTDATPVEWKLVETYYDPVLDMEVDTIQPIVSSTLLLEMSAAEAHAYGFSKATITGEDDLRARYDVGSIIRLAPTWSESLAYWLTSMYVRGFLLVIIFMAAYVEFNTPGVGVAGLVALIGLAIFVGAPYLTGLANVWEILLIVIGVVLVALEVLVIPGFGVAGISGAVLIIVGLLATFVPEEPGRSFPIFMPSLPSTVLWLKTAVVTVTSSMVVSILGMVMLSRYLPKTPVFRTLIPANPTPSQVAIDDAYRGAARVGDLGAAIGPLHPAGKARFGQTMVDVVTQGEYLESAAPVEVVERRGNRVVVRAVNPQGRATNPQRGGPT